MAKPRKPKNEDVKAENSGAIVRHQKLCLSIDMDKRQIYGCTELEISEADVGIVGLHAGNLGNENVLVDGEPNEFEYYPHNHQNVEYEKRLRSVSSPSSAADAAAAAYVSALDRELVPNLLINCCKTFKGSTEQIDQMNLQNKLDSSGEPKQVLSKDDPPCKTYVYRLDVPVTAQWITLVVAPLEILPDHCHSHISHMCLPASLSKLSNTVEFFHNAFSHYETYLDAKFPFGSYKQVFLAPEMAFSSSTFGASMSIFSCQVLYDEKVIDQTQALNLHLPLQDSGLEYISLLSH